MPTPSIQILRTDAQQVLNLDSISAVRSVVAASLANANAGTPLNPNLTTQQLWNEFYQIVTQPKSDIESIIANQLMKFLYAPPAPGGAGADKQVIFNDGGVLAGDPGLTFDKVTNALTITGDLTVRTNKLAVTSTGVGCGTATPTAALDIFGAFGTSTAATVLRNNSAPNNSNIVETQYFASNNFSGLDCIAKFGALNPAATGNNYGQFYWQIANAGSPTTAMTLNATGLGVGVVPSAGKGALQLSSGINFPATQVASSDANTLDDYEEGTWTGTLKGSVSDPTTPVTTTGRYTKIGRQVFVQIEFLNFSNVGGSGNITITGLPFNSGGGVCVGIPFMNKVGTYTGNPIAYLNATTIELYAMTSNSQETTITHNAGTGRYMTLSITYTV